MIGKDIVIAALVRTFFKYYTTGVLESQTDIEYQKRFESSNIKATMLEHYGQISRHFNSEAFYAIVRINYEADEIEPLLKEFAKPDTTDMDYIRFACRTEDFYKVMVNEYKRNFINLLNGRIETQDEHVKSFMRNPALGEISTDKAEEIINRLATKAYECGCKAVKGA